MKLIALIATAAASLAFAGTAAAQGYVGGSVGMSKLDMDCTGLSPCDTSGSGFKLFAGFKLSESLAIEGHFANFGKATAREVFMGVPVSYEFKGQSIGVSAAFTGNFSESVVGTARIGIASNKAKYNESAPGFGTFSLSESKMKPYFGLGLGYKLSNQLTIDGGIDFTQFELEGEKADANMISVGLRYSF